MPFAAPLVETLESAAPAYLLLPWVRRMLGRGETVPARPLDSSG